MEEAAIEAAEDELIHQWLSAGCRTGFGKSLGRETSERKNPVNFAPILVTFKSHTHQLLKKCGQFGKDRKERKYITLAVDVEFFQR